jgi:hypothetical protein
VLLACLLHFDALVAVGSFDCTGRLENEQQSITTIATDNRHRQQPLQKFMIDIYVRQFSSMTRMFTFFAN